MKCEVIRDLIPLYDEKLCSDESSALVEEHIKNCAACKSLLEELPRTEPPKADMNSIKPFVNIKRKLRARIAALIVMGAVLLAVLIPVGYLTVNQIFHIRGGTDFEDLIYKHEVKAFAETIAEGRFDEYANQFENMVIGVDSDGDLITYRSFIQEQLNEAYENVRQYEPKVGEITSTYFKADDGHVSRLLYLCIEFTRSDGSVLPVLLTIYSDNGPYRIDMYTTPAQYMGLDPEKPLCEQYANADVPDDIKDICAFINTLYLAGNIAESKNYDIDIMDMALKKNADETFDEEREKLTRDIIGMRFAHSDINAVCKGISEFGKTNYSLDASVGFKKFDKQRNMFYYPVMLIGSDGENEATVSVKLYFDEYGFYSPRDEDIRGVKGNSDLEMKMAEIFGWKNFQQPC